jgi:hypothetical protein
VNGNTMFEVFLVILAVSLVVAALAYLMWFALHRTLCPKLDPILFRAPYFSKSELTNYLYWPLSSLRSLNYVYLVAAPKMARRKRFKAFTQDVPVGRGVRVACKVHMTLMVLGVLMFFVYFGYLGWALFLYR